MCSKNTQAQLSVLEGLETILSRNEDVLKTQTLVEILHSFYEHDIVTENVFYDWYNQVEIIYRIFCFARTHKSTLEIQRTSQ